MGILPIKLENGIASINLVKSRRLTPRQVATIKQIEAFDGKFNAERYLYNLLGLEKTKLCLPRIKVRDQYDVLADKKPGTVMDKFKSLLNCKHYKNHIPMPTNAGQWVGVEIECFIPIQYDSDDNSWSPKDTRQWLRDKIMCAKIPRVSVKDDASLHDDDGISCEITVLFNSANGYNTLSKVLEILNDAECYVNRTCGLHVHLDVRHLDKKHVRIIGQRLGRSLPILRYIVDKTRTNDSSYNKLKVSRFSRYGERQCAINLQSWFKFKTIEVRLHGGSTNFNKIKNWIELLKFLSASKVPKTFKTFQQLIDLGTPEHLIEYADKRITTLNPEAWAILNPIPTIGPAMPVSEPITASNADSGLTPATETNVEDVAS